MSGVTSSPSRVETAIPVLLRPVSGAIAASGLVVVVLTVADQLLVSPVDAVISSLVGFVAVLGGAIRLMRSPHLWGLGSAGWSAAAAMSLSSASGIGVRFPAAPVITIGVVVSLALTLLLVAASVARRDRRPPENRS